MKLKFTVCTLVVLFTVSAQDLLAQPLLSQGPKSWISNAWTFGGGQKSSPLAGGISSSGVGGTAVGFTAHMLTIPEPGRDTTKSQSSAFLFPANDKAVYADSAGTSAVNCIVGIGGPVPWVSNVHVNNQGQLDTATVEASYILSSANAAVKTGYQTISEFSPLTGWKWNLYKLFGNEWVLVDGEGGTPAAMSGELYTKPDITNGGVIPVNWVITTRSAVSAGTKANQFIFNPFNPVIVIGESQVSL